MQKISLAVLGLSLISCSHFNEAPKEVHFSYATELLETIQQNVARSPASAPVIEAEEGKSARRVYFSSLYHQYLTIGAYLNQTNSLEFCPQFHHDKIETDAYLVPKVSFTKESSIDAEGKNFFPELAFNRKFPLKNYHESLREELNILCEEGLSDNYYKFDNLITHYANNKSFHMKPNAMASVLKIPVFANFYLLKMLQGQSGQIFALPEESRFIKLTHTEWFEKYVAEASRLRNNFVKNKLVTR
jgi:hypothetical protein